MVKKRCEYCGKVFITVPSKKESKKFCSMTCRNKSYVGRKQSKETIRKRMQRIGYGSNSLAWKGGIKKCSHSGYVFVYMPSHPSCKNKFWKSNYIRRSHLVMEKKIGRYLTPEEVVHHINEIKDDDRPENLQLFKNNTAHKKFHYPKGARFGINT